MSLKKWLVPIQDKELGAAQAVQNGRSVSPDSSSCSKRTEQSDTAESWQSVPSEDISNGLPYGDGSLKIFGMENFGNTCYCNSVLQCLYYTTEFRLVLLKYPQREKIWERRLTMPGSKIHPSQLELHPCQQETDKEDPKSRMSLGRRTSSFFGRKKPSEDEQALDTEQKTETQQATNTNHVSVITIPNIRLKESYVLIGKSDDPNATVDARKKNALIKGPVLNLDHALNDTGYKDSLFTALKDVFECITESYSKLGVVSPSYFIDTLKRENELFRTAMHQDAHEFLNFLLNETIDTLNGILNVKKNAIVNLFEGNLTNQTKCLTCENVTSRDETFLDLSLDLGESDNLEDCLKQFSASEMLTGRNKFYCDSCHSLQEAEKKMGIKKLPSVLALHLKRFEYSDEQKRMVKLFHKIKYPLYFRLESDIPAETPEEGLKHYELYGVVVHIGGGPHHGHYVALVKTQEEGWLLFDDETVEKIEESFVLRFVGDSTDLATAYVLFYQEVSPEEFADLAEEKTTPVITQEITTQNTITKVPSDCFSNEFNLSAKGTRKSEEIPSVSPFETLTKAISNGVSISSSQHSTVSSKDVSKSTASLKETPRKGNAFLTRSSSPPSEKSTSSSGFWGRRDSKTVDKPQEKEKKKNRMSMSFGFGRKGQL